jgi:hypothetical protein
VPTYETLTLELSTARFVLRPTSRCLDAVWRGHAAGRRSVIQSRSRVPGRAVELNSRRDSKRSKIIQLRRLSSSEMVARGGVEPPTFRFSGVGITVRRIPLTSAICANASIRTPMNAGERRWMRPLGPGCFALAFAPGAEIRGNGMEQIAWPARRCSLVLTELLVASVVSMVALAPSRRDAVRRH